METVVEFGSFVSEGLNVISIKYNFLFDFCIFQIDLKHVNQTKENGNKVQLGIDLGEFYPSVEWDILGVPAERHEKYYPCCAEPYPGKIILQ